MIFGKLVGESLAIGMRLRKRVNRLAGSFLWGAFREVIRVSQMS